MNIITGYITQQKLSDFFKLNIIPKENWLGEEIKIGKYRYDFGYIYNSVKWLVEFDGYQHYTDALQIRRDEIKTKLANDNGFVLIRFPYWLQLTTQTLKLFFNIDGEVIQNYPHGFIDKKAVLSASFCELGIERFLDELKTLPSNIQEDVYISLHKKSIKYGHRYVYCKGL